jgi:DHA1 family tetracycline resistance protein-like MFS transporter
MADHAPPMSASEAAAPESAAPARGRRAALAFIFVAVTIDTIAMGITAPVLPLLIQRMSGDAGQAGLMNGLFMTVFALMQFLFSPILGALSDRYGRRPILLLSIAGLGLSYAGMAMATSIWQLLLIRLFTGATSANIATAFAYIADVTPADRRAGAYGLMQASMSAGFALGPAVGGAFSALDPSAPFWAAAGFSLINAAYGFFVVPESLGKERRAPFQFKLGSFNAVGVLRSRAGLFTLAMILVLAQFAIMVFPTTFVLYSHDRYGWGTGQITACMTAFGICSFAVQAGLSGRLVRKLGEPLVSLIGMLAAVAGTAIFALAPTGLVFWIGIPFMTLSGVAGPAVQSLMTRRVSATEQGKLQGANTSLQAIAGIIAPVLFGVVYSTVHGPGGNPPHPASLWLAELGAPFGIASIILVIGVVLALQVMKRPARI